MLTKITSELAPDGEPFKLFTLVNKNGMRVQFMDWGATWLSCRVPVRGTLREVLLGCRPAQYPQQNAYLGAAIGRYANRIAQARFTLNGRRFRLVANQGKHQLHGGEGFDKRRWKPAKCGADFVSFSLLSPDGDQGFAGNVNASVCYQLTEDNAVKITFEAQSDRDTPLNLTNHAYFNLLDAENGADVRDHHLQLFAEQFLPVDSEGIPNAPLKTVRDNSFDFRREKTIGADFLQQEQHATKGYDHAFLLNREHEKTAAILSGPDRSLRLTVSTSQPALQVYTGNNLGGTPTRNGGIYSDYSGIALETQALPDTPNHPEWQQYGGISKAGEKYHHWTTFKFS
ncbi:galactose-1-epimerase [Pasteurellaceae bacterium LIM206]|nr:galactose-1-epimerase [Pasteurellaceae bacterium LIM206]